MANLFTDKEKPDLLCPFIGNMVVPVFEKRIVDSPGPPKLGVEAKLFPCQGAGCMFWNVERHGCAIKLGFEALPRVEKLLAPLATFFQSRG